MRLILWLGLAFSLNVHAWTAKNEAIWDTHAHQWLTLSQLAQRFGAGDILVLGEEHATPDNASDPQTFIHHDNQVRLLSALHAASSTPVSVGMEFLNYPDQSLVDQYRAGQLSEADFLKLAWAGNPFDFYRRQILFQGGGHTLALNAPNSVAYDVAEKGPAALTAEEQKLLPPVWGLGAADYYQRFRATMVGHATPAQMLNFFWAQSLWDDTMAWKAAAAPGDILVVIVGSFHVEFGGGLPYELRHQQHPNTHTLLQVVTPDWSDAARAAAVAPDAVYGEHADYLWVHSGAQP